MKIHFHHLLVAAGILLLGSCTEKNDQGKLIPANAAIVVQLDGKSLSAKLPWAQIKDNPAFKEMYSDTALTATLKKILDNPESSGIDIQNDLLFFVQKDSLGGYVGFEGTVKDEVAFKKFNTEVAADGSASELDGISYISKFPVCAGWNKQKFVYVFDAPQIGQMDELSKRMREDSIDITPSKPRDIGATCKAVFALKESNSLAGNERFTRLMKEKGDMRFWMNSAELGGNGAAAGAMALINLDKLTKESVTTAALNFDDGKIVIKAFSYAGDDLTKLYKKYSGGKLNDDMLKRMPGKEMIGMLAMNFKPEGIREFLKMLNLDGMVNLAQNTLGFNLDDFVKANKGDIAVGFSDLKMVADTTASLFSDDDVIRTPPVKPSYNFVFSAAIGDKEAFNKLINAGKKAGGMVSPSTMPLAYNSNGNFFALGNSQANVDQFINGSTNNNNEFINKLSGNPMGGYVNLQLLMKAFASTVAGTKDTAAIAAFDASVKLWDNVLWKGGEFKNDALTQTIEISLLDKNTSSLKQLNNYAAQLTELFKQQRQKRVMNMRAFEDASLPGSLNDSIAMPGAGTR